MALELDSGWLSGGARVEVRDLRVGYGDLSVSEDALRGVSFTVEPLQKVGVIGTTRSGKSTLLSACLRLVESKAGQVLINGIDTRHVGLRTLRQSIGYVPQAAVLYSGTLRENLDPFDRFADDDLWVVLECVRLQHLVCQATQGLERQVGEAGIGLSHTQRQLVSLARLFLQRPALALLDEPMAAVDVAARDAVRGTLRTALADASVIATVHRSDLDVAQEFDYGLLLDRGIVIDQGPMPDLLARERHSPHRSPKAMT